MLVNMKEMVNNAYKGRYAVLAYNTQGGNFDMSMAVCKAAQELKAPIILAHYDTCSEYAGLDYFVDTSIWCAKKVDVPVAVHLDHGATVELCKRAIDLGCSSVMYDGSALPIEENANNTIEVMEHAKSKDVSVEAELGKLVRLDLMTKEDENNNCVDIEDVRKFLSLVKPHALAVAIGNAHGVYIEKPVLNFDLLEEITANFDVPLVLHGGTGIEFSEVQKAITKGVSKVNIGTELRLSYNKYIAGLLNELGLDEHFWKISKRAQEMVSKDVMEYIELCGCSGKA